MSANINATAYVTNCVWNAKYIWTYNTMAINNINHNCVPWSNWQHTNCPVACK